MVADRTYLNFALQVATVRTTKKMDHKKLFREEELELKSENLSDLLLNVLDIKHKALDDKKERIRKLEAQLSLIQTAQPLLISHVNVIEPRKFDGSEKYARIWLNEFEKIAKLNNWSCDEKLIRVSFYLKGHAKIWYKKSIQHCSSMTWFSFKIAFTDSFCKNYEIRLYHDLTNAKQFPGEPPVIFFYIIRDICSQLDVNFDAAKIIEFTLNGLEEKFKMALCSNNHKRFESV